MLLSREELIVILSTMDIPISRMNISKKHNIHWMLRNLGIRNYKHPDFDKVIEKLKELYWFVP